MLDLRNIVSASVAVNDVRRNSSNYVSDVLSIIGIFALILACTRRGSSSSSLARQVPFVIW